MKVAKKYYLNFSGNILSAIIDLSSFTGNLKSRRKKFRIEVLSVPYPSRGGVINSVG